ncbi:MAG: tail fiber domain-containing protein [Aureispira sp.]
MRNYSVKTFLTMMFLALFGAAYGQILTQPLNNTAIHPFGTAFNPFGKLAAIGESGGVPGPTPSTGCDLYGFRAQFDQNTAISIGLRNTPTLKFGILPLITTARNRGLGIAETNSLTPTFSAGCGNLLAYFKQSTFTNNVLTVYGSATASGGSWTTSDRSLKRNIQPIDNALEIVGKLQGYTYEYRRDERPDLNLPQGQRYGFITQEVQEVMPTIVRTGVDLDGTPADYQIMEYDAIIPVLAGAINMQQDVITDLEEDVTTLKEENQALEARLARLEALILKDKAPSNSSASTLMNPSNIQLSQNRPNPSSGSTTIDYTIPEAMKNAQLVVFDLNGKELSSQEIPTGQGTVKINTSQLTTGAYIYAVVVDGRALARKKMIVD